MKIMVFSDYTYTLETLIQAGLSGMTVANVPIRVNPPTRSSRLISNQTGYVVKSLITMLRIYLAYRPFKFFVAPGLFMCAGGGMLFLRYFWFMLEGAGKGHIQSVIFGSMLFSLGLAFVIIALVVDTIAVNRKLLERISYRVNVMERKMSHDLTARNEEIEKIVCHE